MAVNACSRDAKRIAAAGAATAPSKRRPVRQSLPPSPGGWSIFLKLTIIRVIPRGEFVTYGIAMPITRMAKHEKAQGRAACGTEGESFHAAESLAESSASRDLSTIEGS